MSKSKSEIQSLLEKKFSNYTDQTISNMMKGYEEIKKELIKKLQKRNINSDIIKIIEEFK